jgi:hypothetical protein
MGLLLVFLCVRTAACRALHTDKSKFHANMHAHKSYCVLVLHHSGFDG